MTLEQRVSALEAQLAALGVKTLAEEAPSGYYTSVYSGEEIDSAVETVRSGTVIIPSSISGSDKRFRLTVDDSGQITAMEVT